MVLPWSYILALSTTAKTNKPQNLDKMEKALNLDNFTKKNIVELLQELRKEEGKEGTGFDPGRKSKEAIIDHLKASYTEEKMIAMLLELYGEEALLIGVDVDDEEGEDEDETPAPAQKLRSKLGNEADADAETLALARALAALRSNSTAPPLDPEAVRAIVKEEVTKGLANIPANRIEIKMADGKVKELKGHARPELADIITLAANGVNQLIVGPAGSGKTHMAHQVAEALDMEFGSISCITGTEESHLLGYLLPTGADGKFEFHDAPFLTRYINGGVFLFDEIDAADPNVLLVINQALANGSFFIPQRIGGQHVTRHEKFVCIAAANTWGTGANAQYTGRERLDESTLDRFRAGQVAIGYDAEFEKKVCDPELLRWAHATRTKIDKLSIRRVLSTRFLIDATKVLAAGISIDKVKSSFFLGWSSDEKGKVA